MKERISEPYDGYYQMLLENHGRDVYVEVKRNDSLGVWKFTNSWIGTGWLSRDEYGTLEFKEVRS